VKWLPLFTGPYRSLSLLEMREMTLRTTFVVFFANLFLVGKMRGKRPKGRGCGY
jgi:hypothetical protein